MQDTLKAVAWLPNNVSVKQDRAPIPFVEDISKTELKTVNLTKSKQNTMDFGGK
jgi:hypothetical protein